jgi:hypothetical protein
LLVVDVLVVWLVVEVLVVVLVVGVVVVLVGTNLPTMIVTVLPCWALAPLFGDWLITSPFWVLSDTS